MIKFLKRIASVLCLLLFSTQVFAGFLPGTKVFLGGENYKKVKDLKVGDLISIYNISSHGILKERKRIQKKKVRRVREIVSLETRSDCLLVGKKQKLYNRRTYKFIPAEEFRAGDKLFSPQKGNLTVIRASIRRLDEEVDLHEISIGKKNLFLFQTENHTNILAHSFAITIPIFTYIGGKLILPTLEVIAAAVFKGALEYTVEKLNEKDRSDEQIQDIQDIIDATESEKKVK